MAAFFMPVFNLFRTLPRIKLHIAINTKGELLDVFVSADNVDDRKGLERLSRSLFGLVFADKRYLSRSLREEMKAQGIKLITRTRNNMKHMEYSAQKAWAGRNGD